MLHDYCVYFRCFQGPGYWGRYKLTRAFSPQHAEQKRQRIADAHFRNHGRTGEFKIEQVDADWLQRFGHTV